MMDGLHVEEHGPADGPLVALVHGSMDRAAGFARVTRRLEAYRVVRYDRRGYARSRPHPGPFGIDAQVDDLVAVLAGRRAVLVGHSYGGDVVLAAAVRHPELVRSVGAFEPPLPWLDWWPSGTAGGRAIAAGDATGAADAAEAFLRRMIGDDRWERLPDGMRADRRSEGEALVGELSDLRAGNAPWTPEDLTVPVVVGHGERGASHHRRGTAWIAEQVPSAELVVIDGAPHGAHLSHSREFAELVERAVARAVT